MKEVVDQTAHCRKVLKMAGTRVNERCSQLEEHKESVDSARLIGVISSVIDNCLKCQHKGHSEIHKDSHHTIHIMQKTRRMLEAKLTSLEAETESEAASIKGWIIPNVAMSAQTATAIRA